ncbi:MAG: helix-turn-helix domain-containing protein [Trichocoleus desertorum ATA4-8-CV12]|jgi:addiction module HigA family antidote|nr:helix-turn-helix domain-containing protein [Trichocoleus desertorum ATA4-8-CV12]
MSKAVQNRYTPDYVSPPGETLLEILEEQGMTQAELSERTGRPRKTINEIIKGKAALTPETAIQLERVLGIPAQFWNKREQQYREALAKKEEQERLKSKVEWLRQIPLQEMITRGWIDSNKDNIAQLEIVLTFFGVASPEQWQEFWSTRTVEFRKSAAFESDPGALSAWLRKGELEAQKINCASYQADQFRQALHQIRNLTIEPPELFQPIMVQLCSEAGVALVFVPQLPKTRASGATRWLTPDKALIQLSLRYKSDDHLWFSFFHEAGHILLHGKKEIFLELNNKAGKLDKEEEANRFAADFLVPPAELKRFVELGQRSKLAIQKFASEIGITPGIVVGRLQHEGILPQNYCNDLKKWFEWA